MGQVLYRKYRSRSFGDVVGQKHITDTLQQAVKKQAIAHAYLFTGPHGVGKTSVARILAYAVNKVDYEESKTYTDIIEIDAASNRRIDEIRELRQTVNLVPSQLKYKVYIIDEVHMLTREAFNALLKTLEEPPAHAIFILATTELHKVPETIVSRCQRFGFRHIAPDAATQAMQIIAEQEEIDIDTESLQLIASHSQGSFRDALSILDQLGSLSSKIRIQETEALLGLAASQTIQQLVGAVRAGDLAGTINTYRLAIEAGNDPVVLAGQLAGHIRSRLGETTDMAGDLKLLKQLLEVSQTHSPEATLEVILLDNLPSVEAAQPVRKTPPVPASGKAAKTTPALPKKKPSTPERSAESPKKRSTTAGKTKPAGQDDWAKILTFVKKERNTLYGILRMAKVEINEGAAHLKFGFGFHVRRAEDPANRNFLQAAAAQLGLHFTKLTVAHEAGLVNEPMAPASEPTASSPPEMISALEPSVPDEISSIFAGVEVIET